MEIKDDITRKKIELTIEILQAALQGKDIEHNSVYIGWNKIDNVLYIYPAIIENYRIANNYRPCSTKHEFVQLIEQHNENLIIRNCKTKHIYTIIGIYDSYAVLHRLYEPETIPVTFKELFDDFVFNIGKDNIIGIKINDKEE